MIQTVAMAQALHAKAAIVDRDALLAAQKKSDVIGAETLQQDAFSTDVRPAIAEWRRSRGLPVDPLIAFRASGYLERITAERGGRGAPGGSYA